MPRLGTSYAAVSIDVFDERSGSVHEEAAVGHTDLQPADDGDGSAAY